MTDAPTTTRRLPPGTAIWLSRRVGEVVVRKPGYISGWNRLAGAYVVTVNGEDGAFLAGPSRVVERATNARGRS